MKGILLVVLAVLFSSNVFAVDEIIAHNDIFNDNGAANSWAGVRVQFNASATYKQIIEICRDKQATAHECVLENYSGTPQVQGAFLANATFVDNCCDISAFNIISSPNADWILRTQNVGSVDIPKVSGPGNPPTFPYVFAYGSWTHGVEGDWNLITTKLFNIANFTLSDGPPPANVKTPTFTTPPTPGDGGHNATNVTIEFNCTGNRTFLWFDTSNPPTTVVIDNGTGEEYNTTVSTDDTYYYKAGCWSDGDSANSTVRSWVLDTIEPYITVNPSTDIEATNITVLNNYLTNLTINVTFQDDNLYHTLINITNSTGDSVYQRLNTSTGGSTDSFAATIDISSWSVGENYTLKLYASDTHTKNKIKDWKVKKDVFKTYVEFETDNGRTIRVKSKESWTNIKKFDTVKKTDRYNFDMEFKNEKIQTSFTVTCDKEIDIIEDSEWPGHMICGENWIDFDEAGTGNEVVNLKRIGPTEVEVDISNINGKKFVFNSIGGLNINQRDYKFSVGAVIDLWGADILNGVDLPLTATLGTQVVSGNSTSPARFVNLSQGNYTIILNSANYENLSFNYTVTTGVNYYNLSRNLTPIGVKFYLYDEITENLISLTNNTGSIFLTKTGFSNTYTFTANPYTITGLASGIYTAKVYTTSYSSREYFDISITDVSGDVVNAYLINSTAGSLITFNTLDSSSNDIEGVRVNFWRTINGTLTIVAQENTDFAGNARLYLDTNYQYVINFSKTGYNDKIINLEPAVSGSPYAIYMDTTTTTEPPLVESYRIRQADHNLTYTNSTKLVHFSWYDSLSYATNWCLKVWDYNSTYFNNCSTSNNGTMDYIIVDQNQSVIAQSYATVNSRTYILDTIQVNMMQAWQVLTNETLILSWVLYLTLAFIGLFNPIASIVLGIFGLTGAFLMGILPMTFSSIVGLIFVAIVIFVGMKRSRTA